MPAHRIVAWIGIARGKFYDWRQRYGRVNEHNAMVPRDHWLDDDERKRIIAFHDKFPLEGYRRLTFMMLDQDVVAASPATVYRVLKAAGLLDRWNREPSKKGTGFAQPERPHQHWHIDIAYLNIASTFYYLCMIIDGYSRVVVHWEIREQMREADVQCILQAAREKYPGASPRMISDNGPQFIARDFKEYIRICGMTHVRTSPYYPQSNGKAERLNRTVKSTFRRAAPDSLQAARNLVASFITHYNQVRLHSAIGYLAPADLLAGRANAIFAARDRKLATARERRRLRRAPSPSQQVYA